MVWNYQKTHRLRHRLKLVESQKYGGHVDYTLKDDGDDQNVNVVMINLLDNNNDKYKDSITGIILPGTRNA